MTKTTKLNEESSSRSTVVDSVFRRDSNQLTEVRELSLTDYGIAMTWASASVHISSEDEKITLWVSADETEKKKFIKWANSKLHGLRSQEILATDK